MKIRGEVGRHMSAAEKFHKRLRSEGHEFGCLPVAIIGLGGQLSYDAVVKDHHRALKVELVQDSGLELGGFIDIGGVLTVEQIADSIEALETTWIENTDSDRLAGILVLRYFSEDQKANNHFFAIVPRARLPRIRRWWLEKRKKYVVIDSGGGRVSGKVVLSDLAEYMNECTRQGAKFMLFQVYQK